MNQQLREAPAKVVYTGTAHTSGGPDGGSGAGTRPEQLFAESLSACFQWAMAIAARGMKIELPPKYSIDTEVDLNLGNDGYFLSVRLNIALPGLERDVAQALIDAANQLCPYAKAIRGNVDVETNIV